MAIDFAVERGDLQFHASYAEPMFGLWKEPEDLFRRLFVNLSQHGLQLNDLKWNQAPSVGEVQLNFYLFNYAVGVRARLERLEVEVFDIRKVAQEQLERAVIDLIAGLQSHKPELAFTAYSVSVGYHGKLAGSSASEFTRRLTTAPAQFGGQTGAGAVFYYGPEEGRTSSAITADMSAVVADALFFRTLVIWDAAQVPLNEVRTRTDDYVGRVCDGFGLNVLAPQV